MKTITAMPVSHEYSPLRTASGLSTDARVDRERRTIFGVNIIELGDLNDPDPRPYFADETSLQQVLSLGRALPKGVKSRLSHPNASNDGMGRQLGRFRSWRMSDDGQRVLADQHLASFAFRGGDSSIGKMVMDMADEDPEQFGVSIDPVLDHEEMKRLKRDDGKMPLRVKKLIAADIVDEPAATRGGLFGNSPLSIGTAPYKATEALNTLFSDASEEVIRARVGDFMNTYLATRFGGQGNDERDDEMSTDNKPTGITMEDLQAFGESLSTSILTAVDTKLACLKAASDAPKELTPAELLKQGAEHLSQLNAIAFDAGLKDHEKIGKQWFDAGFSVEHAKLAVTSLMVNGNKLTSDSGQGDADPDASYKSEYAKQRAAFTVAGLSEADYIASRKIDDGKELLVPGTAA